MEVVERLMVDRTEEFVALQAKVAALEAAIDRGAEAEAPHFRRLAKLFHWALDSPREGILRNAISVIESRVVTEVRSEVERFARLMEQRLAAHDHDKGPGWWKSDNSLNRRLCEKVGQLQEHLGRGNYCHAVVAATDVANLAMMIADRCDGLADL